MASNRIENIGYKGHKINQVTNYAANANRIAEVCATQNYLTWS